uniref:C-type lectin domain-containing protein n=1 Tax=Anabas testudineus TaxID=64144 RepID=A0AAQ6IC43_ANATE
MDALDLFVNVEEPSESCIYWTRKMNGSEILYQNEDKCHTVEPNRITSALSGLQSLGWSETLKKSSWRAAAVVLGLLCLLLLIGLITLASLYNKDSSKWEMEMVQLQTSYKNLTKEKDQLQTSYNNLTKEKDQLQTSYNNLTKEQDQLQTSYRNLTEEQDQLQKRFEDTTNERNDLKRRDALFSQGWVSFRNHFYYISSGKKSWQQSRNDCLQKGADLVIINSHEEQEFTRTFKQLIWIGLTDMEREGKWKWVDGTPLTTSYWSSHEPNGVPGRDEDCAEIKNYDLEKSWNDESCHLERFWICEKILS